MLLFGTTPMPLAKSASGETLIPAAFKIFDAAAPPIRT